MEDYQQFYADALSARAGGEAQRHYFRDTWLIEYLGMEEEIVMDRIMPMLGYDYNGEVSTITFMANDGCRVEVDVAPPNNGLWEQYKTGDERFVDTPAFSYNLLGGGPIYQDMKTLVKEIVFRTSATHDRGEGAEGGRFLDQWHNYGGGLPQCPRSYISNPAQYPTHEGDAIFARNRQFETDTLFSGYEASGYAVNYNSPSNTTTSSNVIMTYPRVCLHTTQLLDVPLDPFWPLNTNQPPDHTASCHPLQLMNSSISDWGIWRSPQNPYQSANHTAAYQLRRCSDPSATTATWPWTEFPVFPTFRSELPRSIPTSDYSTTYPRNRDKWVLKEAQEHTKHIDFSLQPAGADPVQALADEAITRATWTFELFDVVAVRVINSAS
jgi:hypothetical protein